MTEFSTVSDFEALLRWYLTLSAVSFAFAPAVWWVGKGLGAGRQGLVRPLGLVIAAFVVWWPAAVFGMPFSRFPIVLIIVITGLGCWIAQIRFTRFPSSELKYFLFFELFWLALFGGYVWFRIHNPDIANTEKPMEIALLNSIVRNDAVPAPDPWFAGSTINYYYFGFQQFATIVKLTSIPTSIAFNLSLATIFASVGVAAGATAVGIGRMLSRRFAPSVALALLSALFVLVAGNMETASQLVRDPQQTIGAGWWDGVGWNASRIIYDTGVNGNPEPVQTINEFPAFSFVLGDLHPHLLSYPLLIAITGLAIGMIAMPETVNRWRLVVTGVLVGILYSMNSWDLPVGFAVIAAAIAFTTWNRWQRCGVRLLYVAAGTMLSAFPFAINYTSPVGIETSGPAWLARIPVAGALANTIAVVSWRPSSISELLTVHGLWIVIAAAFTCWAMYTDRTLLAILRSQQEILLIAALILAAISLFWAPALLLMGLPLAGGLFLVFKDNRLSVRVVAMLLSFGLMLTLIPEFLYIQDSFGNRMNTVFKLFFQAWAFLAIGCAAAFGVVLSRSTATLRYGLAGLLVVAVVLAIPYTPLSAMDWVDMGSGLRTLDGAAYLAARSPSEANAVAWISEHAESGDIVVESPGCGYHTVVGIPMNRVSAFTGVGTILGWTNHEGQWRRGEQPSIYARMDQRVVEANDWLNGTSPVNGEYDQPRFIFFGTQETIGPSACSNFQLRGPEAITTLERAGWVPAFDDGLTIIFVRDTDPLAELRN